MSLPGIMMPVQAYYTFVVSDHLLAAFALIMGSPRHYTPDAARLKLCLLYIHAVSWQQGSVTGVLY